MKRVVILGHDATIVAQLKVLLATHCEVVDINDSEGDTSVTHGDLTITVENGHIVVGDREYTPEEFEAVRKEGTVTATQRQRKFLALLAEPIHLKDEDMCCGEFGWPYDDNEYNVSQAHMMRKRDQHKATIRWQHVRPVKARKPQRNSTRGRR